MAETAYLVQLWPNGEWDGKPYQEVYAESPQEAAEKLHRAPLRDVGNPTQIRAQVRFGTQTLIFYKAG